MNLIPDLWQKCLRQSQQLGLKVLSKRTKWMFVKARYAKHLPPSSLNPRLVQLGADFSLAGTFSFFFSGWLQSFVGDQIAWEGDRITWIRHAKDAAQTFYLCIDFKLFGHGGCVHKCDSVNLKGIFSSLSETVSFKLSMAQNNVVQKTWSKALRSHQSIDFMFPALSLMRLIR